MGNLRSTRASVILSKIKQNRNFPQSLASPEVYFSSCNKENGAAFSGQPLLMDWPSWPGPKPSMKADTSHCVGRHRLECLSRDGTQVLCPG